MSTGITRIHVFIPQVSMDMIPDGLKEYVPGHRINREQGTTIFKDTHVFLWSYFKGLFNTGWTVSKATVQYNQDGTGTLRFEMSVGEKNELEDIFLGFVVMMNFDLEVYENPDLSLGLRVTNHYDATFDGKVKLLENLIQFTMMRLLMAR